MKRLTDVIAALLGAFLTAWLVRLAGVEIAVVFVGALVWLEREQRINAVPLATAEQEARREE